MGATPAAWLVGGSLLRVSHGGAEEIGEGLDLEVLESDFAGLEGGHLLGAVVTFSLVATSLVRR